MDDKHSYPALAVLTLDLLREVLQRADKISESFNYILEKIREISGAHAAVLIQHQEGSEKNKLGTRLARYFVCAPLCRQGRGARRITEILAHGYGERRCP